VHHYNSHVEDHNDLRTFIRQTLGCECPDEVLRRIECTSNLALPGGAGLGCRLDVGGRLLVYVLPTPVDPETLRSRLAAAVEQGITDRETGGFNRLRIVLAADDVVEVEQTARRAFADCHCPDARIHLHIVALVDIPKPARPSGA
jgi:hypothetical protein